MVNPLCFKQFGLDFDVRNCVFSDSLDMKMTNISDAFAPKISDIVARCKTIILFFDAPINSHKSDLQLLICLFYNPDCRNRICYQFIMMMFGMYELYTDKCVRQCACMNLNVCCCFVVARLKC